MRREHEYLDDFPELRLVRESCGISDYIVGDLTADAASRILQALPANRELTFHDPEYPSPSDPGAYISVRKEAEGFRCGIGNHGWSHRLPVESAEWLAACLQRCLPHHQPERSRERLQLSPVLPSA
jgi:hypothetical protein